MYNDCWGSGLARRALLEAGRRLKESGVLPDASLAINASHEEIVILLTGGRQPSVEELRRRQTWRETKTLADAPAFLGAAPKAPPPVEWLPKKAQANARVVNTIIRNSGPSTEISDLTTDGTNIYGTGWTYVGGNANAFE